jgi:hypothetical protein
LVGHGRGWRQLPSIAAGGPRVQEQESAAVVLVLVIELDEGAARRRHDGQHQRRQTDSDKDDAVHGGKDATHVEASVRL